MARLRSQLRKRRMLTVLFIFALLLVLPAYEYMSFRQSQVDQPQTLASSDISELATQALGKLAVKSTMPRDGYSRSQFGVGWAKSNGCDTRNLILQRDLIDVTIDPTNNCTVYSGVLEKDPYTEKRITFQRGYRTSSAVQIEHIVALSDAWQKGAQLLDKESRIEFANDGLNLIAVDGPANMQKGDKDAANWLPVASYRCKYVARQIAIKLKYQLWVTLAEHKAMKQVLSTCPSQRLPLINSQ
jgi:hypothetical protein